MDFDLALEVAQQFRVKPKRAREILEEVGQAVQPWREVAKANGIPHSEIDHMQAAFRLPEVVSK